MDSEESDSVSGSKPPLSGGLNTLSQFIENMGMHFAECGLPCIPAHRPARARLEQILAWTDMVRKSREYPTSEWQSCKEELV